MLFGFSRVRRQKPREEREREREQRRRYFRYVWYELLGKRKAKRWRNPKKNTKKFPFWCLSGKSRKTQFFLYLIEVAKRGSHTFFEFMNISGSRVYLLVFFNFGRKVNQMTYFLQCLNIAPFSFYTIYIKILVIFCDSYVRKIIVIRIVLELYRYIFYKYNFL